MEIKKTREISWTTFLVSHWQKKHRLRRFMMIILALTLLLGLFFFLINYGVRLHVSGQANSYLDMVVNSKDIITHPLSSARHYWQSLFSQPDRLILDIKQDNWQILEAKHKEAVENRSLFTTANPEVPAVIRTNGESVKVDVRLKGGSAHWSDTKWSLRVKVDEPDKTLLGLKTFSIQDPSTRNDLSEWVFHRMLTQEDVLSLTYKFVDVTINGRPMGIYALEQHYDKLIPEGARRREGPIFSFSEDLYKTSRWPYYWPVEMRNVEPYEKERINKNPELTDQFMAARSLIELYREDQLSTCQVFDCPILARYFAINDLLGTAHAAGTGNFKMYYNPVTAKIEPIGFDGESNYNDRRLLLLYWSYYTYMPDSVYWLRQLFSDEEFFQLYVQELYRVSDPSYLDNFFADVKPDMDEQLSILWTSRPAYQFDKQAVYDQQIQIRNILNFATPLSSYLVSRDQNLLTIDVGTVTTFPVEIKQIKYQDTTIPLTKPIRLAPMIKVDPSQSSKIARQTIQVTVPSDIAQAISQDPSDLQLGASPLGLNNITYQSVEPLPRELSDYLSQDLLRQKPNHNDFPFIETDEQNHGIGIKPGHWQLNSPLIFPPGYTVFVDPGTTIDIARGGQIISHSPVVFRGQPDNPVTIHSANRLGRGLFVLNTGDSISHLEHTIFEGLAAPAYGPWQLTGSVTFYDANLHLSNSIFRQNRESDDALNIIRSDYKMDNVTFEDAYSDGFDCDFSNGVVSHTQVINSGNDAFDFSGSEVTMNDISITGAGDKGISVGENSNLKITNLSVTNSVIGIASKDSSHAVIDGAAWQNLQVGSAVYQKKPEFTPASLTITNASTNNVIRSHLVEKKSQFEWNGQSMPDTEIDVFNQLEKIIGG